MISFAGGSLPGGLPNQRPTERSTTAAASLRLRAVAVLTGHRGPLIFMILGARCAVGGRHELQTSRDDRHQRRERCVRGGGRRDIRRRQLTSRRQPFRQQTGGRAAEFLLDGRRAPHRAVCRDRAGRFRHRRLELRKRRARPAMTSRASDHHLASHYPPGVVARDQMVGPSRCQWPTTCHRRQLRRLHRRGRGDGWAAYPLALLDADFRTHMPAPSTQTVSTWLPRVSKLSDIIRQLGWPPPCRGRAPAALTQSKTVGMDCAELGISPSR